jgi:hypothetical protein
MMALLKAKKKASKRPAAAIELRRKAHREFGLPEGRTAFEPRHCNRSARGFSERASSQGSSLLLQLEGP